MKNQLSPPVATMARPVPLARAKLSNVQCTIFALQASPVRRALPAEPLTFTLFSCLATSDTASATAEFGTSRIMSTPSRSNHWRASAEPTSGLFWWSAKMISTLSFVFGLAFMKSSSAMRAAMTEP